MTSSLSKKIYAFQKYSSMYKPLGIGFIFRYTKIVFFYDIAR